MSKIEVDTIAPQSGTTVTLGESGDTITIPAGATFDASSGTLTLADGSVTNAKLANSAITINGSSVSLGGSTTIETGTSWQSTIVTGTTLSAVAGNGYWIDTTSNACTVTLPASASVGDTIEFVDYARTWATNGVTLNTNGLNFQNASGLSPEYSTEGQSVRIIYSGATGGWIPTDDDDVQNKDSITADYLVVAGGGSGAGGQGGGGGAGGYLTGNITLTEGVTYTATVGGGGNGVPGITKQNGNDGSDSVLSGAGLSTITAIGGGAAGAESNNGAAGGSGGGGGQFGGSTAGTGGSGTVGQGFDGGDGYTPGGNGGGGGGGAAEAGNIDAVNAGGDGLSNSITGTATFYAGGGGGSASFNPAGGGAGGDGGGTDGESNPNGSDSCPANTGGGSGGVNDSPSGNGGSGVVILRLATSNYTGTTTGSPTVTTDGSDTIIKFTGSGSYTA
jgi:hypothetical protein